MQADLRDRAASERWRRIETLYHRAQACEEGQRTAFLEEACAGDEGLRRELESLLGYTSQAERFIEEAPVEGSALEATRDSESIPAGRELGSYKVLSLLGAGGMGKVYLAKDTRLERTVAIKVLAHDRVADAERKRRFMQEARAASALNHPNIVTIYDISSDSGIDFLVMEYVEGKSLQKRITSRGLPVMEAIGYATQIASALVAAHAAGIVHRDIKPANAIVTEKGLVKVLDFGLAKLAEPSEPAGPDSDTEATRTREGVILGTAAYMSPEQASGKRVDARSDIFSVGAVLYEMLTGRRAFDRGTVLATLGAVLYENPAPLGDVVKTSPPELERILERCLRKDPDRRIQTMADLRVALEELQESPGNTESLREFPAKRRPWVAWTAAASMILAVISVGYFLFGRKVQPSVPVDFKRLTSMNGWEVAPSWNFDGTLIAFSNNKDGNMDLFMMPAAGGEPRQLTTTPYDEVAPRWSPNFKELAFVADRGTGAKVHLMPALGNGEPRELADTALPSLERFGDSLQVLGSMPWDPKSQELLYTRATESGGTAIWRINVMTGEQEQWTHPEPGDKDFNATWSFDGKRIAFERMRGGKYSLWVMSANGNELGLVTDKNAFGGSTWSADSKKIVFVSSGSTDFLNIWEIEVGSGQPPRQLTNDPSWDQFPVVSRSGRLAYVRFEDHRVDLYKIPYKTPREATRVTDHTLESFFASFSKDGRSIVYQTDRTGNNEIYLRHLDGSGERNLTQHPKADLVPAWSPDGSQIMFVSNRNGKHQVWIMNSDGGSPRVLMPDHTVPFSTGWPSGMVAPQWSPDGRKIAFVTVGDRGNGLWVADRDGRNARAVLDRVLYFDWYQDSRHIIFVRRSESGTQILAHDLENAEEAVLLPDPAMELAVSRDGTKLLFSRAESHFNMNLWVQLLRPGPGGMPMLAGVPTQITDGRSQWHVHKGAWSPDGEMIVYTQDSDQGDIYTIEDYR